MNDYYGGQEAAFSLNEAEAWVEAVEHGRLRLKAMLELVIKIATATSNTTFRQASVRKHTPDVDGGPKLSFSRAYSLTLSPQLIYNRSALLPALVSSKVYQQLEFLVVGSWWIYDHERGQSTDGSVKPMPQTGCLRKIPSSREDVANDQSIDLRSKRNVMRFLQLAADADAHPAVIEESGSMLFRDFLSSRFKMAENLHALFHALTLSPDPSSKTTTAFALPRIHRHLTSIGLFGPGFGAVIPKWGGLAEIAQVACRAGAVGGGVYVLNKGIKRVERKDSVVQDEQQSPLHELRLSEDEVVKTNKSVGSVDDLPSSEGHPKAATGAVARSIDIVSSTLDHVFPPPAEGAAPSAAAVVVFPSGSFESEAPVDETAPIYLVIHSSDTGECPNGQSMSTLLPISSIIPYMMTQNMEYLSTLPELCVEDNLPLTV